MRRLLISALVLVGLTGCKADRPGGLETAVITSAKHHIFIGNKDEKNPLPDTAQTRTDGKEAFSHYCVACHGNDGQNTGVPFADHISPPIPSLASPDVQQYTDGQLKWILDNGIRPSGMPGSKGTLSDDELWSIIAFLRHLPAQGSQGMPEMYTH
ncbi:c-type cytochrome [Silvibacterium acidisoli]|uniref:c-type cytochrome n=1 Tax=Acidobacteriaceae bacterium ZG23-2 TaxID=2883246 RepID=UPI00406C8318